MRPDRRGSWYLLTGAVLGVAMGLVYSWVISPVKYVDAPPYALRADYKDDYRALVAVAYMYSEDLVRAEGRLKQLKDDQIAQTLTMQAERSLADGHPQEEVRALNTLAMALGGGVTPGRVKSTTIPISASGDAANPPDLTTPGIEPAAGLPATPTPGAPFMLGESRQDCDTSQPAPLIQVDVRDAAGQPVPGIEVVVTWDAGEAHIFTGSQPEMSAGSVDYIMTTDTTYTVSLINGVEPVSNLEAVECEADDGSHFWGSVYLLFVQP